ncbi:MAG: RHS domain-containing protein [Proteobacteria bacterium]|nr:RHS domain-containing protein [Pseudomonadota bacterium]MBU1059091.1 RHS domain-containing protein [Pseudomonadota bacterium]
MKQFVTAILFNLLLFALPAILAAEEVTFYHTDNFGTPMAMTNVTGAVVWRADELPFGEEYQTEEISEQNNRRFLGKELDKETGLIYMGARYMDPKTGRFNRPDPVGLVDPATGMVNQEMLVDPQRHNRYVYGLNNPYRYVDPDGREVTSNYDKEKGVVTTTDLDTGTTFTMQAESGGKPYGKAIEAGEYDILNHPNQDFVRLEAKDKKYGNDIHDSTNRSKFRMHKPGNTVGCIAAKDMKGWVETRDLIRNTSSTTVEVDSKSRNPFASKKETIKKFGTLTVTD